MSKAGALDALTQRFQALAPGDDAARLAFVQEVDGLLLQSGDGMQPGPALGLHWMAAEALDGIRAFDISVREPLLEHARQAGAVLEQFFPDQRPLALQLARLRASAYIRFQDALPAADYAAAIEACDAFLAAGDELPPGQVGPGAYWAALWRMQRDGLPRDAAACRLLEALFAQAQAAYRQDGRLRQASDAAFLSVQVTLSRLEHGGEPAAERAQAFESAWRAINGVLADCNGMAEPLMSARGHMLAAALVRQQPGMPQEYRAVETMKLMDRALQAFERAGAQDEAAACAGELARALDGMPSGWDAKRLQRYELYLDTWARGTPLADEGQALLMRATSALMRANAVMKVFQQAQPDERPGMIPRLLDVARQAAAAAVQLGQDEIAANAHKLLGSALMDAGDAALLPDASAAFELALAHARGHARAGGDASLVPSVLRLRAAALGHRLQQGELDLGADCLAASEEAIAVSAGEEAALACANYASTGLMLAAAGRPWPVDRAEALLRQGFAALRGDASFRTVTHLRGVVDRLAEERYTGAGGMEHALQACRSGRAHEGQAVLAAAWQPAGEEGVSLLWGMPAGGHDSGPDAGRDASFSAWSLERSGDALFAHGELSCPACGRPSAASWPLVLPRGQEAVLQQPRTCPHCRAPQALQWCCLLHDPARAAPPVLLVPDRLATGSEPLRRHQMLVLGALARGIVDLDTQDAKLAAWMSLSDPGGLDAHLAQVADSPDRRLPWLRLLAMGLHLGRPSLLLEALQGRDLSFELDDGLWDTVAAGLPGLPPLQLKHLRPRVAAALDYARKMGPVATADALAQGLRDAPREMQDLEDALRIAADRGLRRDYLARLVAKLPDHSAERAHAFESQFLLHEELRLRAAQERGDPEEIAQYSAGMDNARRNVAHMIERDQQQYSSARAKQLLAQRLQDDQPFVLVLRAFALDNGAVIMDRPGAYHLGYDDPRIKWRVTQYGGGAVHHVDTVCRHLPPGLPALAVANVGDMRPPELPALFFVSDIEWQRLVFSLVAEAASIVLIIPAGGMRGADGVAREISAIVQLARAADTVCVRVTQEVSEVERLFGLGGVQAAAAAAAQGDGTEELGALGFGRIVALADLAEGDLLVPVSRPGGRPAATSAHDSE